MKGTYTTPCITVTRVELQHLVADSQIKIAGGGDTRNEAGEGGTQLVRQEWDIFGTNQ